MNDSIDQNVYEDLHARVNDGDDGKYGINNPLERLDSSRNQVVLAWDKDEPLLINTDLKTCQQCGSKMRNKGGKKECKDKQCDKCGWSVVKDGYPALVKLDHGYPRSGEEGGDIDPKTGEFVPGYTSQIHWMNELGHKYRRKTPDVSVIVGGGKNEHRLLGMGNIVDEEDLDGMSEQELIENMSGAQISFWSVQALILMMALALFIYRMTKSGNMMSTPQILCELCMVCYYPICYVPIVLVLMFVTDPGEGKDVTIRGKQGRIVYQG